jgi:hypothetical protein
MNRASVRSYDLFKLVVTIALVVILVLMLLRGCATTLAAQPAIENIPVTAPAETIVLPSRTASEAAIEAPAKATSTPAPADATSTTPPAKATPTPSPEVETAAPTPDGAASTPAATETSPAPTKVAGPTSTGAEGSCTTSVPSRLDVGQTARVVQRLNMRSDSSITAPILMTHPVGSEVEIIGGPVCQSMGKRAYLWWQIQLPDGTQGWSAESPLNEATYLLEPSP